MSEYTASPRRPTQQRQNRTYDEVPVTLESESRSFQKERDSKPLRSAVDDEVDTPTYRKLNYQTEKKVEEPRREYNESKYSKYASDRKEEPKREYKYTSDRAIPEETPSKRSSVNYKDYESSRNQNRGENYGTRKETESKYENSSYRESRDPALQHHALSQQPDHSDAEKKYTTAKRKLKRLHTIGGDPVSYTHLTLPTICSV